jgi:hypothetical protein
MMSVLSCGRILVSAIAILDIGGVNDGVEQQTQRIYEKTLGLQVALVVASAGIAAGSAALVTLGVAQPIRL